MKPFDRKSAGKIELIQIRVTNKEMQSIEAMRQKLKYPTLSSFVRAALEEAGAM